LAYALANGRFAAAQALVGAGASVSMPVGPQKLTPLMITASQLPPENRAMALAEGVGPLDVTRLLVARGADVNAKSTTGMTALMVAAVHDNPAMIGVLVQLGADPSAKEAGGHTARELALVNGNEAAAQILSVLASTSPKPKHPDAPGSSEGKAL
jgi:ankyrin repeat protein